MDKKTGVIIGILLLVVLGLICFAFIADFKDSSIITINDIGYDKADFEKYYKLKYFEEKQNASDSEDENSIDKEKLKETALSEFASYMIINKEAKEKGYKVSEDMIKEISDRYDEESFDKEGLTALGLTRDDYINTRLISEMANDFVENAQEYYDVPESSIENYFETNKDQLKGYDLRIMNFNITSTEATTNEDGEEVPATSNKDEIIAKAQEIMDKVKAGEDFETLAKENADSRYALSNSELKQYNGELESVDLPYLSSYLMFSCSDLEEPIKAIENAGEYTELVTTDSYVAFARIEAIRDNVQPETREAMEKEVANSVASSYVSSVVQSSSFIVNSRLLKSINI